VGALPFAVVGALAVPSAICNWALAALGGRSDVKPKNTLLSPPPGPDPAQTGFLKV
jgi:hypothetical protein